MSDLVLILLFSVVILFWIYIIKTYTFWTRRNVPQASLLTTLKDVTGALFATEPFVETYKKIYKRSQKYRYYGAYELNCPILIIRDENLRKTLTIKDFEYFSAHRPLASKGCDSLWDKNIFALEGYQWRSMRNTLNPLFTGLKIRLMYKQMIQITNRFMDYHKSKCNKNNGLITLEFKDSYSRLANDIIASCIFGVKVDSLQEKENEFYMMGKEATSFGGLVKSAKILLVLCVPKLAQIFGIPFYQSNVRTFFTNIVSRTITLRQKENFQSSDLISFRMQTRTETKKCDQEEVKTPTSNYIPQTKHLSNEDIASQAAAFLIGGFESLSSSLGFLTYELAINPQIQHKLRQEILEHVNGNISNLTYESLMEMKYLDMVVCEGMRKWPTVIFSDRVCTKDYIIKSENDNEKDLLIKCGEAIFIPIFALHYDAEIYPEPEKFDPERFNAENKTKLNSINYMPFGIGQRQCIGMRFTLLEIKIVIAHLLSNFEILPTKNSTIPMRIQKSQIPLHPENGFWLSLKSCQ